MVHAEGRRPHDGVRSKAAVFHPETIETGPITNHVNFARTPQESFAYVTVGGLNELKVFRTEDFVQVATVSTGKLPHGVWPSGDGSRIYVGLENDDALVAIDAAANEVVASVPIGQAPQAIAYVPNAVPQGDGMQGLQPLGTAGQVSRIVLAPVADAKSAGVVHRTRQACPCSTKA